MSGHFLLHIFKTFKNLLQIFMLIKCLHPGECGELADLLEDFPLPGAQGERGRHSEGSCFSRPDGSSAETFSSEFKNQ